MVLCKNNIKYYKCKIKLKIKTTEVLPNFNNQVNVFQLEQRHLYVCVCVGQWVIVSVVALMHYDFHSVE